MSVRDEHWRLFAERDPAALHIAVFAKPLVPGRVKTRLIPALGAAGAAALQRNLLDRTLTVAREAAGPRVSLWVAGDPAHATLGPVRDRFRVPAYPQQGADLGARMRSAIAALSPIHRCVLLIGSDCPVLAAADLRAAGRAVNDADTDAVFIPVEDGGYVLVGLGPAARDRRAAVLDALFGDIAWGTARVMAQTRARLVAAGFTWREQPMLWDIDRPEDLLRARALGVLNALPE
ncbi:TIGR04282 family arsenosugar biosynthesis glycosyltransferase [Salinisphaera sp.]|uniref:TIGR04282 family arsenosugar biosynthesis glycosyltransferase n=1 Tax=Salinisphaera sp. TaxID=1914330 RepID=UPI002D76C21C|nr:TIGR04282 family arsenosugar biosynthesis glycosyltransferase [Salinisphaera sp.]HET7314422.1 TIGR04282 family arsenosugar biosynthesis glycosyltransferase [Salinisphaera sp.]